MFANCPSLLRQKQYSIIGPGFRTRMKVSKKNHITFYLFQLYVGFGEYFNVPAVLSEEVDYLGYFVEYKVSQAIWERLRVFNRDCWCGSSINEEGWILGASFNSTSEFESHDNFKCDEDSCYEKSISERKICKPGKLYLKNMTESNAKFLFSSD